MHNNKVVVAVIGTNSRGKSLAQSFARLAGAEVSYVCDVDQQAGEKAAAAVKSIQSKDAKQVKDFRRILEDRSVDALVAQMRRDVSRTRAILASG